MKIDVVIRKLEPEPLNKLETKEEVEERLLNDPVFLDKLYFKFLQKQEESKKKTYIG